MGGRVRDGVDSVVANPEDKGKGEPSAAWSEVYTKKDAKGAGDANTGQTDTVVEKQAANTGDPTSKTGASVADAGPAVGGAGAKVADGGPGRKVTNGAAKETDAGTGSEVKPANGQSTAPEIIEDPAKGSWSTIGERATIGNSATVIARTPTAAEPLQFGTEQTKIYLGNGQIETINHNPPRTMQQVIQDWQRLRATEAGLLQPRERRETAGDTTAVRTGGTGSAVPAEKLVGFFADQPAGEDQSRALPIRVLRGQTISSIISGKPFGDVGEFGVGLYRKAFAELYKEGKFTGTSFDDGNFNNLEKMFAQKVAQILPEFRQNWTGELTQTDREFIKATGEPKLGATTTGGEAGMNPRVVEPKPDTETDRKPEGNDARPNNQVAELKPLLTPESTPNVLNQPLINERLSPDLVRSQEHTGLGGDGRSETGFDKGLGQFTDLEGNRRPIIRLTDWSIKGLLMQPGVLPEIPGATTAAFDAAGFAELGQKAAEYRNKAGVPGPDIGAPSAELYVRVFRAMGITRQDLFPPYEPGKGFTKPPLGPEKLGELFDRYLAKHSPEAGQVVNGGPARPEREVKDRNVGRETIQTAQDGTRTVNGSQGSLEGLSWKERLNETEMKHFDARREALEKRVAANETLGAAEAKELAQLQWFNANRNNPGVHAEIIKQMGDGRPQGGFSAETLMKSGFNVRGVASPLIGASFLVAALLGAQAANAETITIAPRRAKFN